MDQEKQISALRLDFSQIREQRETIITIFEQLSQRIVRLKKYYEEFMSCNQQQSMLVFGLDSFNFQYKLVNFEYHNMQQFFKMVSNRMYGDYYKLFKIMTEFVTFQLKESSIIDLKPLAPVF